MRVVALQGHDNATPCGPRNTITHLAVFYMNEDVKLDYLYSGVCLMGAVYFMFRSAGAATA
jgi:hypothetical protein